MRLVITLGKPVSPALLAQWREWLVPAIQPFQVDEELRAAVGATEPMQVPMELKDTYLLYGDETLEHVIGLSRDAFDALPQDVRARLVRHQARTGRRLVPSLRSVDADARAGLRVDGDGHRFVWWPDTLREYGDAPVLEFVAEDMLDSRHGEVGEGDWEVAAPLLPGARSLAGTFPPASGPNCFGTVMAAAGEPGAADVWMLREPFEEWLARATCPGGDDQEPGTVLIWRDAEGLVQHAAVTIGGGWALNKSGQGWMSPRQILTVREVKRHSRSPGRHLSRRSIAR